MNSKAKVRNSPELPSGESNPPVETWEPYKPMGGIASSLHFSP
jgi:hypothetical protein